MEWLFCNLKNDQNNCTDYELNTQTTPHVAYFTHCTCLSFPDMSDQVLRVFKADQQSRYIMIGKDTTAKEVVVQAIREFALTAAPEAYSLCEVSVTPEGVIKQRRLPDQLSKLADRIQLSGR